ncbi:MAG: putative sugar nucleotidyl transferase, partial [Planctomycetota bacterium]
MRLILVDSPDDVRGNFYPLALSRPLWELRCGFNSLEDKLIAKVGADKVAYFVADYMADAYRAKADCPVNDTSVLEGDDLLIVDPRIKADSFNVAGDGPSEVGLDEQGGVLYARIAKADLTELATEDIGKFMEAAKANLPNVKSSLPTWQYIWDLILANAGQ